MNGAVRWPEGNTISAVAPGTLLGWACNVDGGGRGDGDGEEDVKV